MIHLDSPTVDFLSHLLPLTFFFFFFPESFKSRCRVGDQREVQERGDMCISLVDSC